MKIGTPQTKVATRAMLLGSGELGKRRLINLILIKVPGRQIGRAHV